MLEKAKIAAINFHPAPREYPGIGGYNYAIYNGDTKYGATCHIMEEKVDSGVILDMEVFHMYPNDTVESLKERTMVYMLILFFRVAQRIIEGKRLDVLSTERVEGMGNQGEGYVATSVKWKREPYTRKDLQDLCNFGYLLLKDDEYHQFEKWYNACYFPNALDKPSMEILGIKYYIIREDHYDGYVSGRKLSSRNWNYTTHEDI